MRIAEIKSVQGMGESLGRKGNFGREYVVRKIFGIEQGINSRVVNQ